MSNEQPSNARQLDKQKVLEFLNGEVDSCGIVGNESDGSIVWECNRIASYIHAGMFDSSGEQTLKKENERLLAFCKLLASEEEMHQEGKYETEMSRLQNQLNQAVEALKTLPEKIFKHIDSFADTEELTFPMKNPTDEDQEEWLETFLERMEDHTEGIIDDFLSSLSQGTEETNG